MFFLLLNLQQRIYYSHRNYFLTLEYFFDLSRFPLCCFSSPLVFETFLENENFITSKLFFLFCEYRSIRELHTAFSFTSEQTPSTWSPSCPVLLNLWSQLFRFIQTNALNKSICFSCIVQFENRADLLERLIVIITHSYVHTVNVLLSACLGDCRWLIVILIYINYFFTGLTLPRFCKNQRLGETSILCTKIMSLIFICSDP